jgi:hypothetical protein
MRAAVEILLFMTLAGCASTKALSDAAARHDAHARALEAQGRYEDALREREAADDQRVAAARRAPLDHDLPPAMSMYH